MWHRHFIILLSMLVSGCGYHQSDISNTASLVAYSVSNGQAIYLAPAGASWYTATFGKIKFRAKNAAITSGSAQLPLPSANQVTDIELIPANTDPSQTSWQAVFDVTNDNPPTLSLQNLQVIVSAPGYSIALTDLEQPSMAFIVQQQEAVNSNYIKVIQANAQMTSAINTFLANTRPPNTQQLAPDSAAAYIGLIPSIMVYDGPTLSTQQTFTATIFLEGYRNTTTNEKLIVLVTNNSPTPSTSTSVLRLQIRNADDSLQQEIDADLSVTQPYAYFDVWATSYQFTSWWQANKAGMPLPSNTPTDAGVVTHWGLLNGSWGAEIYSGNQIPKVLTITGNAIQNLFPGQCVRAIVGQVQSQ